MLGNRDRDVEPWLRYRRALWKGGIRGCRLHWRKVPGRPDLAFPVRKLAVFVNSCYWHRCPHCALPLPKSHREFWKEKFERNQERDLTKSKELVDMGWRVCVIWESKIKKELDLYVADLGALLNE